MHRLFAAILAVLVGAGVGVLYQPAAAMPKDKTAGSAEKISTEVFGQKLADAAKLQLATPVIYDPTYRKLEYPMGDVAWYVGVCTDVVVRAYRQLGIDLQPLVYKSRVGSGDRNIDHRRVLVLRKFFKRKGQSLSIGKDPSKFKPGDLVTYHVPDGLFSKTHIAIVSDRKTWGGVPMIIHNRGYGVQEEDALFAEKITGHYRYRTKPNIAGWKENG